MSHRRWGEPGLRHIFAPSDAWIGVLAAVMLAAVVVRGMVP